MPFMSIVDWRENNRTNHSIDIPQPTKSILKQCVILCQMDLIKLKEKRELKEDDVSVSASVIQFSVLNIEC